MTVDSQQKSYPQSVETTESDKTVAVSHDEVRKLGQGCGQDVTPVHRTVSLLTDEDGGTTFRKVSTDEQQRRIVTIKSKVSGLNC